MPEPRMQDETLTPTQEIAEIFANVRESDFCYFVGTEPPRETLKNAVLRVVLDGEERVSKWYKQAYEKRLDYNQQEQEARILGSMFFELDWKTNIIIIAEPVGYYLIALDLPAPYQQALSSNKLPEWQAPMQRTRVELLRYACPRRTWQMGFSSTDNTLVIVDWLPKKPAPKAEEPKPSQPKRKHWWLGWI